MQLVKEAVKKVADDVATGLEKATGLERHLSETIEKFAGNHIEPIAAMRFLNQALEANNKAINILHFCHTQLYQDGLPQYTSDKYPSEKLNFRECKDGEVTTERNMSGSFRIDMKACNTSPENVKIILSADVHDYFYHEDNIRDYYKDKCDELKLPMWRHKMEWSERKAMVFEGKKSDTAKICAAINDCISKAYTHLDQVFVHRCRAKVVVEKKHIYTNGGRQELSFKAYCGRPLITGCDVCKQCMADRIKKKYVARLQGKLQKRGLKRKKDN